ncbi:peptidoglycan bridge formation glycyltransferase FemA/FemB family protein [Candidatus Peregrinibacteria bacterium]|nr:peptidoglycan bridge formation glycyltransferase FemA/FemB family protein [Candidatus Peregrinibacteria bacterium]
MSKQVVIIESDEQKKLFNAFVENHELGSIHQTIEWGEFQKMHPDRGAYWPIAVFENEKIVAIALLIRQKLPFGLSWLYCPRGPLADFESENFKLLLKKIKTIAKQEKSVFLRIDPAIEANSKNYFRKHGFKKAHAQYQPETTTIIESSKLSEAEILVKMKPKGRYNIKLAKKKGVEVTVSEGSDADVEKFYELLSATTSRDGFSGHSLSYYKNMLKCLGEKVKLYLAKYDDKVIAASIVTFCGKEAVYYFGASSNDHRNVMAPYFLQWKGIEEAVKKGMNYDFLGIAPLNADKSHSWAGVTDFKLKFGGIIKNYFPAQEKIYQPLMFVLIRLVKKFR